MDIKLFMEPYGHIHMVMDIVLDFKTARKRKTMPRFSKLKEPCHIILSHFFGELRIEGNYKIMFTKVEKHQRSNQNGK